MRVSREILKKKDYKIHSDVIILGDKNNYELLTDKINSLDRLNPRRGYVSGTETIDLGATGLYLLLTGVGTNSDDGVGVYAINRYSSGYSSLNVIKESGYVDVSVEGNILTISRTGNYIYGLLKLY